MPGGALQIDVRVGSGGAIGKFGSYQGTAWLRIEQGVQDDRVTRSGLDKHESKSVNVSKDMYTLNANTNAYGSATRLSSIDLTKHQIHGTNDSHSVG